MASQNSPAGVSVGDEREQLLVERLNRTQIVQYAGASGDFNPLHTDERFATKVAGQDTVIAHGMLTLGMAGRIVTDWFGPESVVSLGGRFVASVRPGDRLVARARVTEIADGAQDSVATLSLDVANQRNDVVLSGRAKVRLKGGA